MNTLMRIIQRGGARRDGEKQISPMSLLGRKQAVRVQRAAGASGLVRVRHAPRQVACSRIDSGFSDRRDRHAARQGVVLEHGGRERVPGRHQVVARRPRLEKRGAPRMRGAGWRSRPRPVRARDAGITSRPGARAGEAVVAPAPRARLRPRGRGSPACRLPAGRRPRPRRR